MRRNVRLRVLGRPHGVPVQVRRGVDHPVPAAGSEERRVGEEGRSRGWAHHLKKKESRCWQVESIRRTPYIPAKEHSRKVTHEINSIHIICLQTYEMIDEADS